MSEELQKTLDEFLAKVISGVEKAGEFTIEQIPDVIQQALTWMMVESILYNVLALLFILTTGVLIYASINKKSGWAHEFYEGHKPRYWVDTEIFIPLIPAVFALVLCAGIVFNLTWLKIWITPKWFIVTEMCKLL